MKEIETSESLSEGSLAMVSGCLAAGLVGVFSFVLGIVVDVALELLPLLALLVPLGLAVGTWTLSILPSALAPILGRAGFFMGIYGIARAAHAASDSSEL